MAWRSSGASHADLVANLARNQLLTDPRALAAFRAVDRADYAPRQPYADAPQSIGHGVTISAPHMHAIAVEQLVDYAAPSDRRPDPRILDVGAGSGYLTHVLAELAGPRGRVVGVDHIPALVQTAADNMRKSPGGAALLAAGRVRFVLGDGRHGVPHETESESEPFDAIHVGASAAEVHPALLAQLRAPGRLFLPLDDAEQGRGDGQHVWTIDKDADGRITRTQLFPVRYVPLTDAPS